MDGLPAAFRDKWSSLAAQHDSTGQSFAKILGDPDGSGLVENSNDAHTLGFTNGALVSYDSRTPPVLVYGEIYGLWKSLGGVKGGFGHPLTDPQSLGDGSICSIFVGGHIHKSPLMKEAEPFPLNNCTARYKPPVPQNLLTATPSWPPHFRNKWSWLASQRDVTGKPLATVIGTPDFWNAPGFLENRYGQTLAFENGLLTTYDDSNMTAPFLICGKIYQFWNSLGGLQSGFGQPIADPQILPDGSMCSIFQGGHIHQKSPSNEPEAFPANQCKAAHQPSEPPSILSPNWPKTWRNKWTWLSTQRGADGTQLCVLMGPADSWPHTWPGLTDNANGGQTLHFRIGKLVSYDDATLPFLIYGNIHSAWSDLGGLTSGLGHPLADPEILPDGSTCSKFEGGHLHQSGKKNAILVPTSQCVSQHKVAVPAAVSRASPYWPQHFRDKWAWLLAQRDPSGEQLGFLLGPADSWPHTWAGLVDNDNDGQTFHFRAARLISYDDRTAPFPVYGKIFTLWDNIGGIRSGLGHPIADPQFLEDGTTCIIFEGGHVHQFGKRDAEIFSASKCTARHKPTVPPAVSNASKYWPQRFREKWTWLSTQRDPNNEQIGVLMGPTDSWPHSWGGLADNDNGGQTLHFRAARLVSYDDRTAPFPVYGKIFTLWDTLGGIRSGLGHPIADPQFLQDGSTCIIFEGGHVHQTGKKDATIFPASQCTAQHKPTVPPAVSNASKYWPQRFREKWTWLSAQRDPNNEQIGVLLGPTDSWPHAWGGLADNNDGGQTLHFRAARLISYDDRTAPFPVYGKIFALWDSIGGLTSGLGRPIADPQFLRDGSTCIIFEGGHVHQIGKKDAEFYPANECSAENKAVAPEAVLNSSPNWPQHFRKKWTALSTQRDPSGQQIAVLMGPADSWPHSWPGLTANEGGGKTLHFRVSRLVSYYDDTEPFLVYGKILDFWLKLGGTKSVLGYPLADPQYLADGSTCSIFEGGHVHQRSASADADLFQAAQCTAANKPTARPPRPSVPSQAPVTATYQALGVSATYQAPPSSNQMAPTPQPYQAPAAPTTYQAPPSSNQTAPSPHPYQAPAAATTYQAAAVSTTYQTPAPSTTYQNPAAFQANNAFKPYQPSGPPATYQTTTFAAYQSSSTPPSMPSGAYQPTSPMAYPQPSYGTPPPASQGYPQPQYGYGQQPAPQAHPMQQVPYMPMSTQAQPAPYAPMQQQPQQKSQSCNPLLFLSCFGAGLLCGHELAEDDSACCCC